MERIKIYVDVTVMNDKYGHIKPLSITWEDGAGVSLGVSFFKLVEYNVSKIPTCVG